MTFKHHDKDAGFHELEPRRVVLVRRAAFRELPSSSAFSFAQENDPRLGASGTEAEKVR